MNAGMGLIRWGKQGPLLNKYSNLLNQDGREATNGDMDCAFVICPNCGGEMTLNISVEYMCTPFEGGR
jgi:hypothetical protein